MHEDSSLFGSFSTQSQPLLFQGQYARSMLCLLRLAHEYVLQEKGILTLSANIFADRGERGRGGSRKKKKYLHIISLGILHFPNYSIITMFSFIGEIIFTFVELPINCKEIHFFQNHMGYSKYLQVCILF
nr:hypothetical protein Iba_chr14aCG24000 [Ipomoea batatas]